MCSAKCAMPRFSARSYREPAASITKHATDCALGSGAVRTRNSLGSVWRSKTGMRPMLYRGLALPFREPRAQRRASHLDVPGLDPGPGSQQEVGDRDPVGVRRGEGVVRMV